MHRPPEQKPDTSKPEPSAAAIWPPLRPFISGERRLGLFMARRPWTAWLYELLRFGIGMNTDHTLEEVGQQFSVTRERIRQIEAKALRKLKHPSRSRKLRSFLDN